MPQPLRFGVVHDFRSPPGSDTPLPQVYAETLDQIRLIARTLRDKVWPETFAARKELPKTLIFAKSDAHADDIVTILREEFGEGDRFAAKITYKTTGTSAKDQIQAFRNQFWPRVAVTVAGPEPAPPEMLRS